ncbi:unnamed protein product [Blepharisma stoltei]|uniref:EF-hand domain-containing protein n=1 Tax=Blepharisma stoltei TaxID=1481888 RepID=A0AAU9IWM5_9CILI|nr:unnamed protein product [Blepharisma stoltei]
MITTRTELLEQRRKEKIPDVSYDIDGDGNVSPLDYFVARRHDKDKDGKLTSEERIMAKQFFKTELHKFILDGENHGPHRPNRLLQINGIPIYHDDFSVLHQNNNLNTEDIQKITLKTVQEKRRKEKKDTAKNIADTKIIHKNPFLIFPRNSSGISYVSKISMQKKLEKETAREVQGLSKIPDALNPRVLSTNYNEFPKIQSKSELDEFRKTQATEIGNGFGNKLLKKTLENDDKWAEKVPENTGFLNFKQRVEEMRKKDVERTIKLFEKIKKSGIHDNDLPKFQENCKKYWERKRSATPTPNISVPSNLNSDRQSENSIKTERIPYQEEKTPKRSVTPTPFLKQTEFIPKFKEKSSVLIPDLDLNHQKKYKFTETFTNLQPSRPLTDRAKDSCSSISHKNIKISPIRTRGFV